MVRLTVPEKYNDKKLEYFITDCYPSLSRNVLFKAFRQKDIKVNGKRTKDNILLHQGDIIEVYIDDNLLNQKEQNTLESDNLEIVYQDNNILIVNKQPGIPVESSDEESLLGMVKKYLGKTNDLYHPALCHRLDRNTGGLVIFALNSQALDIMLEKIKNREIKKYYQCIVVGCPSPKSAELRHYLFKDSKKSQVYIYGTKKTGSVEIITRYKVLEAGDEISKLEVELVTGRTHQIRAHLAYIGHPLLGDGKYGINDINRRYKAKHQALWAYKVVFDWKDGGILDYLKGKTFEVENIDFNVKK